MIIALPELAELLILFGALLFIYLAVYIIRGLSALAGGTIGKLPVVGGWVNAPIHAVEHKLVGAMQEAAAGVDAAIGYSLHEMARLVDWTYRELKNHSNLLYLLGAIALGPGFADATRAAINRLTHHANATATVQQSLTNRLIHAEERLARGIGEDVLPRVRTLEREYSHVIGREIPALRARERELERGAAHTWEWIRSHPLSLATGAFAGAVAIALQRLGGSWIRCRNWNRIGKHVCGLPLGLIEDLLATAIIPLIATDLCAFAAAAETVAHELTPVLLELVDVENALVGCHGATTPPLLTVRAPGAPPVRNPLPLAA